MSGDAERLVAAARAVLEAASKPVEIGTRYDAEDYVIVPANRLTWLNDALSPEQRESCPDIRVSPKMKFGEPCIAGHRLPAGFIADHYWYLGESLQAEILDAYELTRGEVVVACWFVAAHGTWAQRKRWKPWLDAVWANTGQDQETNEFHGWWSHQFEDVPLPPTKKQHQEAHRDG